MLRNYYGSRFFSLNFVFLFCPSVEYKKPRTTQSGSRRERNGGEEEEEVRETGCGWIDTKQLSAGPYTIKLTYVGVGGGGGREV